LLTKFGCASDRKGLGVLKLIDTTKRRDFDWFEAFFCFITIILMVLIDLIYSAGLYTSLSYIGSIGQVPICVFVGKLATPSQVLPFAFIGLGAISIFEIFFKKSFHFFGALCLAHTFLILFSMVNLLLNGGYCSGVSATNVIKILSEIMLFKSLFFLVPLPAAAAVFLKKKQA
jgi:hypothetical protein